MNAVTGYGIISAVLTLSISSEGGQFVSGTCAVVFGVLGITMEIVDRVEKRKVAKRGNELSGPSR